MSVIEKSSTQGKLTTHLQRLGLQHRRQQLAMDHRVKEFCCVKLWALGYLLCSKLTYTALVAWAGQG